MISRASQVVGVSGYGDRGDRATVGGLEPSAEADGEPFEPPGLSGIFGALHGIGDGTTVDPGRASPGLGRRVLKAAKAFDPATRPGRTGWVRAGETTGVRKRLDGGAAEPTEDGVSRERSRGSPTLAAGALWRPHEVEESCERSANTMVLCDVNHGASGRAEGSWLFSPANRDSLHGRRLRKRGCHAF